jgi:hypothetical protein
MFWAGTTPNRLGSGPVVAMAMVTPARPWFLLATTITPPRNVVAGGMPTKSLQAITNLSLL